MKQKVPIILLVVAIGSAIFWRGIAVWPHAEPGRHSVDTFVIDETHGIGGTSKQANKTASKSNDNEAPPSTPTVNTSVAETSPRQQEIVASIAVEYPYKALLTSNDPFTQSSWALQSLKAPVAWDTTTGSGTIVAVIDSGFALQHEDLQSRWYKNQAENGMTSSADRCWNGISQNKASNNCDDDANGYVDDWRGWDFSTRDNSPAAGTVNPNGAGVAHGTEVAGLVGAEGNNAKGIATVAWNNQVMPLQALDDNGSGYTSSVVSAIYYAVDNGAAVINMSLGGSVNDPALAAAISYAYARNVVIVAAAGNCGTGTEDGCDPSKPGEMGYPALNDHVIAVGATTSSGGRASFSSYGPGLDVVAPGSGSIPSPMWTQSNQTSAYASSLYGTSFASPLIASYVGLLKAQRPASSVNDITALVDSTAGKTSAMSGSMFTSAMGHGIADVGSGIRVASALNQLSTSPELLQIGGPQSEHTLTGGTTVSSGCKSNSQSYCTIWARNVSGYDRYLPYTLVSQTGSVGWSWAASWLGTGEWSLKAISGDNQSDTPYILFSK